MVDNRRQRKQIWILQPHLYRAADGHGLLRYGAVHGENVDAVSGGVPEGGAKIRVGGVVGVQVFYVRHLNDEQNARAIPFSGGAGQTTQMLRTPVGASGKAQMPFSSSVTPLTSRNQSFPSLKKEKSNRESP